MNGHQKRIGGTAAIGVLAIVAWVLVLFVLPGPAHAQTPAPPSPTRPAPVRAAPASQATPVTPQMPCIHLTTDGAPGSSFVGGPVKERCFAFPGDAGAIVSFVLKSASAGVVPAMELRGPDGKVVARSNTGQIKEQALPLTGPYAVIVLGANLPKPTRIEASVAVKGGVTRPTQPSSPGPETPEALALLCSDTLSIGQVWRDIVPFPGAECRFTVTARRGQSINIWMKSQASSLQPELTLLDPSGALADSGHITDDMTRYAGAVNLPVSGVYTVIAGSRRGQSAGAFELTLTEGAGATCGDTLTLGVLTELQLPAVGRSCDVAIDAPYGSQLGFTVQPLDGAPSPAWQARDPMGNVVGSSSDVNGSWRAERAGRYTVRLSSFSRQPQRVLVQFPLPPFKYYVAPSCGGVLSPGTATTAVIQSIAKADPPCLFTLDGTAGNTIWVAVSATASGIGFEPVVELMAPGFRPADAPEAIGNDEVFAGMSVIRNHTLARTGRYTVRVSDYGNDDTGSFFIRLWKW